MKRRYAYAKTKSKMQVYVSPRDEAGGPVTVSNLYGGSYTFVPKPQVELGRMTAAMYSEYLKGEHWAGVRRVARRILKYRCGGCGSGGNLQLHHRRYDRIGREDVRKDLIWVCGRCHVGIHELQKSTGLGVRKATKLYLKRKKNGKNL